MTFLHLGKRGGFELADQVISLNAQSLAPANFYVGLLRFVARDLIAHFGGATWCKRYDLVVEMDGVLRFFRMTQCAKPFRDDLLQVGLASVDHVIHPRRVAKMRRSGIAGSGGRSPYRLRVRWIRPLYVVKILAEQSKLPQLVGNIFAHVSHRAIGTH